MNQEEAIQINKSRSFTNEYDHNSFSVVRVYNRNLKKLGGRNSWVKLQSNSSVIYRMIKAGKSSPGFSSDAIETDYDSLLALGEVKPDNKQDDNGFYECDLSITPATKLETLMAYWKHPDHGYRISIQISLVSLILGLFGLIMGFIGMAA